MLKEKSNLSRQMKAEERIELKAQFVLLRRGGAASKWYTKSKVP